MIAARIIQKNQPQQLFKGGAKCVRTLKCTYMYVCMSVRWYSSVKDAHTFGTRQKVGGAKRGSAYRLN